MAALDGHIQTVEGLSSTIVPGTPFSHVLSRALNQLRRAALLMRAVGSLDTLSEVRVLLQNAQELILSIPCDHLCVEAMAVHDELNLIYWRLYTDTVVSLKKGTSQPAPTVVKKTKRGCRGGRRVQKRRASIRAQPAQPFVGYDWFPQSCAVQSGDSNRCLWDPAQQTGWGKLQSDLLATGLYTVDANGVPIPFWY